MAQLVCDDCGYETEDEPDAGDDWPDGVMRPVWPKCPECREQHGVEVSMRCVEGD